MRPKSASIVWGIAIGIAVYAALTLIVVLLATFGLFENASASQEVLAWAVSWRIVIAVAAGLVEEVLYRGYAIERLSLLTGGRASASAVALAAFALAHVPFWGWAGIAVPLFGGLFFTLLYLWRRDLITCIAAHSTIDLIGVVLLPALAGHA